MSADMPVSPAYLSNVFILYIFFFSIPQKLPLFSHLFLDLHLILVPLGFPLSVDYKSLHLSLFWG